MKTYEIKVLFGIDRDIYELMDYHRRNKLKIDRKISFQKFLEENPEAKETIEQFDVDSELIYYCNWEEVTGKSYDFGIADIKLNDFFKRMFLGRTRGMRIFIAKDFINSEPESIVLWNEGNPDPYENYQNFLRNREEFQ